MTKPTPTADLILHRGLFTTLSRANPTATAVAIRDGRFIAVGADKDVMALAGQKTKVVDLKGRRGVPVRARVAGPDERAELWPRLVELYADFAKYQAWTEREIPVVVLSPR